MEMLSLNVTIVTPLKPPTFSSQAMVVLGNLAKLIDLLRVLFCLSCYDRLSSNEMLLNRNDGPAAGFIGPNDD